MIDTNAFLGLPLKFNKVCTIYPPIVKQIVENPKILQFSKLLTYSQEDIEELLTSKKDVHGAPPQKFPTPLEFILINSYQNKEFEAIIKEAFAFFLHEPVTILYDQKIVIIGSDEDLAKITDLNKVRSLSEENFFDFQNTIRDAMGEEREQIPDPNENSITKRIKLAGRRRKRLASKNKKGISFTTSLGAICCMGIGLNPLNIGEISYASVDVLMNLYQQKEKYQTDIDSLVGGADPKKVHPKYWIRDKSEFNEIKI